jgi:hypothetical protein
MITAVAVSVTNSSFSVGAAQPLFRINAPVQPGWPLAVTPDGQRFLAIIDISLPAPLTVALNWQGLLKK